MPSTAEQPRTDQVSEVYAQALLELSDHHGVTDAMAEELADLSALLTDNADLRRLLESRVIGREERTLMIQRLFEGKMSDALYRFIQVLNRKNRLDALQRIVLAYTAMLAARSGRVTVQAFTATPMDPAAADHVRGAVAAAFDGREIELSQIVDESLIGGLKLRVGDQLIDGSVATQLKLIKRNMVAAGRQKARAIVSQGTE